MKQIAVTAILTVSAFCAVLYTSCSKDACKGVTCINNGTCSGGTCSCPSGAGGNNCQTIYRILYTMPNGTYTGLGAKDTGSIAPDSATMVFSVPQDTIYTNMTLVITDSANKILGASFPITLTNNSASGSNFTITSAVAYDTFSITGTGSISTTQASVTLTLRDNTDTLYHTISYTNFNREP
jgi:hypothetical protein